MEKVVFAYYKRVKILIIFEKQSKNNAAEELDCSERCCECDSFEL